MSGRPALLMSRDVKQVCIGTKRAGASRVEIPIRGTSVIVHFDKGDDKPSLPDGNNSFDKIMRKPGAV